MKRQAPKRSSFTRRFIMIITMEYYLDWKLMNIWVTRALKRTVAGDWRFDNLCGSHLQSQVFVFNQLKTRFQSVEMRHILRLTKMSATYSRPLATSAPEKLNAGDHFSVLPSILKFTGINVYRNTNSKGQRTSLKIRFAFSRTQLVLSTIYIRQSRWLRIEITLSLTVHVLTRINTFNQVIFLT